jgi:hypothetical protein
MTFDARPQLALLFPKMAAVQAQSPIATASFGSGIAAWARWNGNHTLLATER